MPTVWNALPTYYSFDVECRNNSIAILIIVMFVTVLWQQTHPDFWRNFYDTLLGISIGWLLMCFTLHYHMLRWKWTNPLKIEWLGNILSRIALCRQKAMINYDPFEWHQTEKWSRLKSQVMKVPWTDYCLAITTNSSDSMIFKSQVL